MFSGCVDYYALPLPKVLSSISYEDKLFLNVDLDYHPPTSDKYKALTTLMGVEKTTFNFENLSLRDFSLRHGKSHKTNIRFCFLDALMLSNL